MTDTPTDPVVALLEQQLTDVQTTIDTITTQVADLAESLVPLCAQRARMEQALAVLKGETVATPPGPGRAAPAGDGAGGEHPCGTCERTFPTRQGASTHRWKAHGVHTPPAATFASLMAQAPPDPVPDLGRLPDDGAIGERVKGNLALFCNEPGCPHPSFASAADVSRHTRLTHGRAATVLERTPVDVTSHPT